MPHIILIGTLDTKLKEFLYLHEKLREMNISLSPNSIGNLTITSVDCGRSNNEHPAITISQEELVARYGRQRPADFQTMHRGDVIKYMTRAAISCVKDIIVYEGAHGIMGAGGSGGTSLISAVMREAAPIGMPKLIVSTVASGDTSPIVGETDITLMYSVVDIAGRNELLRNVLSNAAGAILGMSTAYEAFLYQENRIREKPQPVTRIGITMFGVTTQCVDQIVQYLNDKYYDSFETYIFHATGHGGRAMERLVEDGRLDAVLDLTTTEICDYLAGGNMSAGPNRLEAALKAGIPYIISLGATDMVNFGPKSTIPEKYKDRLLLEHNPMVTLMRTTKEECEAVGNFIVGKINTCMKDPEMVEVWLPHGGVSIISTPGEVFADSEADTALVEILKQGLSTTGVRVVQDKRHVNEKGFGIDIAESLLKMVARNDLNY